MWKRLLTNDSDLRAIGKYEIVERLGHGSSGFVFKGRDPYIKRDIAIKVSQPNSQQSRDRFLDEARSAGRLQHPNIVSIYDAGVYEDLCYITMEYIEGNNLERFCRAGHLLPPNRAVELILSLCNALDYAHKMGIIHRDIKPSNILIDREGHVKITDFGIAQMAEQTARFGIFGTPSYMSPEQIKDEVVENKCDIFALGCVLYELLTGRKAFIGDNCFAVIYNIVNEAPEPILGLKRDLPKIFGKITRKALAKEPKDRYQNCVEFAYDLRVALRGMTGIVKNEKAKSFVDFVHRLKFFQDFTATQVKGLVSASQIVKFRSGNRILADGKISDTCYILLSGRAKVRKNGKDIAWIEAGECFGEMAYIAGQERVANVVADRDCILIKISASFLDRSSEAIQLLFYKNFAKTLVRRLCKTSEKQNITSLNKHYQTG